MRILLLVVAALVALNGCSASTTSSPGPSTSVSLRSVDPDDAGAVTEVVEVELRSASSDLHTVGPDGRRVFGWNLLVGPSEFLGEPVEVRLQGSVEYTDGNGPFDGFLRLVATDGSQMAFYIDGQATAGDPTQLPARMDFIGASGRFSNMVGAGQFRGSREAEVGAPVVADIELTIDTGGVVGTVSGTAVPQPVNTDPGRESEQATPQ